MNPSPASPYGGSTVKVDVDLVRVIVLTRVTSEKLTRRKDHADNRLLQHVQYLELYLNNQKGKLTEVGQLMESVCVCQRYWSHFYCTGVHHTIPFINCNMMAHCHHLWVHGTTTLPVRLRAFHMLSLVVRDSQQLEKCGRYAIVKGYLL